MCRDGEAPTTHSGRHGRGQPISEGDKRLFVGFAIAMLGMIGFTLRTIYHRWKKFQSAPIVELDV